MLCSVVLLGYLLGRRQCCMGITHVRLQMQIPNRVPQPSRIDRGFRFAVEMIGSGGLEGLPRVRLKRGSGRSSKGKAASRAGSRRAGPTATGLAPTPNRLLN